MNSRNKLYRILIGLNLVSLPLYALAMAGPAERMWAAWLSDFGLWISMAIFQVVFLVIGFIIKRILNSNSRIPYFVEYMCAHKYCLYFICAVLYSFSIAVLLNTVNTLVFGALLAFLTGFLYWLIEIVLLSRRKIVAILVSPSAVYYLLYSFCGLILGFILHPIILKQGITWPIIRLFYVGDGYASLEETIRYTNEIQVLYEWLIYTVIFMLPWLIPIIKRLCGRN